MVYFGVYFHLVFCFMPWFYLFLIQERYSSNTYNRIECGESPYGVPFHLSPHAAQHTKMKSIFREMAAVKGSACFDYTIFLLLTLTRY